MIPKNEHIKFVQFQAKGEKWVQKIVAVYMLLRAIVDTNEENWYKYFKDCASLGTVFFYSWNQTAVLSKKYYLYNC